jgi:hypothetical protein
MPSQAQSLGDHLRAWRRLRRQVAMTADPVVSELLDEVSAYPVPRGAARPTAIPDAQSVAVPFKIATSLGVLSFLSTTTVFGTPLDVTLSELALELFFAADAATDAAVRGEAKAQVMAAE